VDKRKLKLKRIQLAHIAWTRVLAEAAMQKMHRSVSGPDQAWFLGELDRYLEASPATTAEKIVLDPTSWRAADREGKRSLGSEGCRCPRS